MKYFSNLLLSFVAFIFTQDCILAQYSLKPVKSPFYRMSLGFGYGPGYVAHNDAALSTIIELAYSK